MAFKALVLDIEGTTTPISFVTDVLFPHAEAQYASYIRQHWSSPAFAQIKASFAAEDEALVSSPETLISFVQTKHAKNEKHTAFKALQGQLWKSGYESGALKSMIYEDVPRAINRLGVPVSIYSSGSIDAQILLFKYSDRGDLTPHLQGYFDTSTAGPKIQASSYSKIVEKLRQSACDVLFLSDNVKEVEAAKEAGLQSYIVERPGNAPLSDTAKAAHRVITSFDTL
ncbi:acireductone synthase-like protein [Protomyces lactucae-debilis]|uniref:Acireductone synthase-like protein n=1 Tax=Protomyces lactucae-debilis TaxID=2754530 RepID=A0A1Y2F8V2_PROLT|nr:acireductone synthase-like protein [Protomyces lactucae-debilis]ORY79884.1 acireductone synthase-like protein [Protomyces lactucae-debilis]